MQRVSFFVSWNFDGCVKVNELFYSHPTTFTIIQPFECKVQGVSRAVPGVWRPSPFRMLNTFFILFAGLRGTTMVQPYRIHKSCVAKLQLNCPHFRLGLRISSSTRSWVALSFFRCKTARCRSISGTICVCVCVLWFVPSNHWMLYMFCMRRIAFVTYSCVAEQFKLHRDVYLYTVFGCIHASLQQFSLCFSNVMCEWGYIGRFTGTCLYIVCNVCIYIAKVVSSIHRNNFILLTITWLVVIYKNRQYIRVHVTHVAE